ncbi:MAG: hypothetical protein R6V85_07745 [Polyangia bacterium]
MYRFESCKIAAGLALVVLCGCAAGVARRPDAAADPPNLTEAAERLTARGDHLGASLYLEAALARGAPEREVLPDLIAAQVRAGRLRAARDSVRRLAEISPGHPSLQPLAAALEESLAPQRAGAREVRR